MMPPFTQIPLCVCFLTLTDGFAGIYCSQLSPKCWSADSQRVLISCPQRSLKVHLTSVTYFEKSEGLRERSLMFFNQHFCEF